MARPICEVCKTYEGTPHRDDCPLREGKPVRRKLLLEAIGTFETGEERWVMEYMNRLKDLPESGFSQSIAEVEECLQEVVKAEERAKATRRRWRTKAMDILQYALSNWSHEEVQKALFGSR